MAHGTAPLPPSASPLPSMDLGVMSMLPVPDASTLSADQRRGAVCVWCATELTTETAVDLGHRRLDLDSEELLCFPRACRPCARTAAVRESRVHPLKCEQCAIQPTDCRDRHAIRRLALDGRR